MQHQLPPPAQMMQMITSFWSSCCIYVAAKLGIADHLAAAPMNTYELAKKTESDPTALYRVLRALASIGIFTQQENGTFSVTPLGQTLQSDVPGSMRAMAIAQLGDHYAAWGNLLYSVQTGNIAFDQMHGMSIWKYYEAHPEDGVNFMKAMSGLTSAIVMNVVPAYDWSSAKTLVDIGGGNGALMFAIVNASPATHGIIFDSEYVVAETQKIIEQKNLTSRCSVAGGSFFESVPKDADIYIMKMIIHDWDDNKSVEILNVCAHAMKPGSKLLIIVSVVPEGNVPHPGKFMDINMLAMTGGRERTEKEFIEIISRAGLKMKRVIHTQSPMFSIIESEK